MDSRLMSSRAGNRPMTSVRPVTGIKPLTSTGLVAPKSSRGRTGLRRQVQDKTYWMGVIKAKMAELTSEINSLTKEHDALARDESRMGVYQKKAESLAKELTGMTSELTVLNEYKDRLRSGENGDDLKEEIGELKADNDELSSKLETMYEEKKRAEDLVKVREQEIESIKADWDNVRRQFSPEEMAEYTELERQNQELAAKCDAIEAKINKLSQKKSELENVQRSGNDAFLRKEILQSLERLQQLEKQRDDLVGESNTDERSVLLAQVKRDNKEIVNYETRLADILKESEEVKSELDAYDDTDAAEKCRELKQKESQMDSFLNEFDGAKKEEEQKMVDFGANIDQLSQTLARVIAHIDALEASDDGRREGTEGLMDEKRKLELDLNKIEQLEAKINNELDSLRSKIRTLETDIETYSDIPKLKRDIDEKSEKLREDKEHFKEKISDLKKVNKELRDRLDITRGKLDNNEIYTSIKNMEAKLTEVLMTNTKIKSEISVDDTAHLKKLVLDDVKKYNQKLQGY
ncbi:Intraflagellar transport protein 74 -like protein [Halotydeus destructor]|nr:Intraflagellar transport protein 74 -like protein [Halotydeus destructor]